MTPAETVAKLDAIRGNNPASAHDAADDVLLASVPAEVRKAYLRVVARTAWWVTA